MPSNCPLCGAPPREGSVRCPQCGWASAEALAAQDDLPVYGEPSPPGPREEPPERQSGHRRGRGPLVAGAGLVVILLVGTAVRLVTESGTAQAEIIDTRERVELPAAVEQEPSVAWRQQVEPAAILGVGGTVVASLEDGVVGYDARTGERRWRLAGDGLAGLRRLGAGRVLVTYGRGNNRDRGLRLVAVDADDGRVHWRSSIAGAVFSTPLGRDHVAVLAQRSQGRTVDLVLLAASDGTRAWTANGAPVAVGDDTVYLVDDDKLRAVDLGSGEERWSRNVAGYRSDLRQGGAEVGDTVVVARTDTRVVGLSAVDGTFLWSSTVEGPVIRIWPVGDLVVTAGGDTTTGVDPDSGDVRWSVDTAGWREFPLVQLAGRDGVYALGEGVALLDPATGEQRAEAGPGIDGGDATLLAKGLVYMPPGREEVQALEPGDLDVRWSIDLDEAFVDITAADDTVAVTTGDELIAYR